MLLCVGPGLADDPVPEGGQPPSRMEEGLDLLGDGARMLFEGLAEEVRPQLDEMLREVEPALRGMIEEMGPALNDLAEKIGDLNAYHPPERLPNGDILLRRKQPAAPAPEETPLPAPDTAIDL